MDEEIVKRKPRTPAAPVRQVGVKVDKALCDEYEKTFNETVWIRKEMSMLLEQYMRDRLARYRKNHPKG